MKDSRKADCVRPPLIAMKLCDEWATQTWVRPPLIAMKLCDEWPP